MAAIKELSEASEARGSAQGMNVAKLVDPGALNGLLKTKAEYLDSVNNLARKRVQIREEE